ncbi:diacylglycerol/lipid kinase family protein [Streptomyces sp. NPDC016172]|uniref:diacylglycerol/lipid kinase family protein n=1 Tax=Streptomyces sp. NPDC016172 TaxID=3364964 RepID=UPI0036F9B5E6
MLVPLTVAGLRSVLWVLVGVAGLALAAAGMWWTLAHTGAGRVLGAVGSVIAPATVLALYAAAGMLGTALLSLALWAPAVAAARIASAPAPTPLRERPLAEHPRHPWILMNPRSGGGKVDRHHLADKAGAAGARAALLGAGHQDVAQLARQAVSEGADLLGMAGGDGTQALVAEVAARCRLPFVVILPAGTRNHFALDLDLDRDDPAAALDALTDGVEVRVDLGFAADRDFVNNASFGTYAAVVSDPAYRDDKVRTALQTLPGFLTGLDATRLRVRSAGGHVEGLQALLVSNNPYRRAVDSPHPGRRERLDSGRLGVLGVHVENTARAARMVRGARSPNLTRFTAEEVVVEADTDTVPAGIDGPVSTGSTSCRRHRWPAASRPARCASTCRATAREYRPADHRPTGRTSSDSPWADGLRPTTGTRHPPDRRGPGETDREPRDELSARKNSRPVPQVGSDSGSAPGRIRTCAHGSGGRSTAGQRSRSGLCTWWIRRDESTDGPRAD